VTPESTLADARAGRIGDNGRVTSATTTSRAAPSRGKPDQVCADAVDLARGAVTEDVAGAHIDAVAEGDRVVTHYFECTMPAYLGWRWAVTVARIPRSKQVTVCESVLLPGPDALVTPDWIPWEDRVAPGDLGIGDLMPTAPDDERLAPGYLLSDDPVVEDVVWELGLGRVRVLSRIGRLDTAERWYEGDNGPHAPISQSAPPQNRCVSCGFYLPLAGAMRAMFGVCANVYAPDDGRVVSGDHGCGAHSEILVEQTVEVDEAPTIYDDGMLDRVEPEAGRAAVEPAIEETGVPVDDAGVPEADSAPAGGPEADSARAGGPEDPGGSAGAGAAQDADEQDRRDDADDPATESGDDPGRVGQRY